MARVDGAKLGSWMALALTAACSSSGGSATGGQGGAVGHGGQGTTGSATSSSSAVATVGSSGFGGFGGAGGAVASSCDPPPDPSTLWAQAALSYPGYADVTLCPYVGDVLLVVNTAAV